jgi:putative NADPH-quinone reductase
MVDFTNDSSYADYLFTPGSIYTVGINDGTTFKQMVYKGSKLFNGKHIMVFETLGRSQLTVNPSYHSFTVEECDAIDVENDLLEAKGDSDG